MPNEKELDNDEKVAAGIMSRYTRACSCGETIKANALPMPSLCAGCAARAQPESNPAPGTVPQ